MKAKATSKHKPKPERILTIKEQNLVDMLPVHNWSVIKAGLAAGYKPSYAKTDLTMRAKNNPALSKAIQAKRKEVFQKRIDKAQKQGWTLDKWRLEQAKVYQLALDKGDTTGANTALRQYGQHIGAFEADNTQKGSTTFASMALALIQGADSPALPEREAQPMLEASVIDGDDDGVDPLHDVCDDDDD